jgi:hypothetical protein
MAGVLDQHHVNSSVRGRTYPKPGIALMKTPLTQHYSDEQSSVLAKAVQGESAIFSVEKRFRHNGTPSSLPYSKAQGYILELVELRRTT